MKFILESSQVPIYDRIAQAFAKALIQSGHNVYFIDTSEFIESDFTRIINSIEFDYYLSTNELNFIQRKSEFDEQFIFEKVNIKIAFIHHDNLFSAFNSLSFIVDKIGALSRINNRSIHFCIEKSNVEMLKLSGIENSYKINHASEFTKTLDYNSERWGVTFIGHFMSSLNLYPAESITGGHHLKAMAWNRFCKSSYAIQPAIKNLVRDSYFKTSAGLENFDNYLAAEQYLIAGLNKLSSPMRGQLISTIKKQPVNIFGGDLSYGRLSDPLLILKQDNIYYNSATSDYQYSNIIYQSSRINLNISSLQFDTAINNRIVDVAISGGFLLTDKRAGLEELIPFYDDITYESPEEMNEKINYWLNQKSNKKYFEIRNELFNIFSNNFTYQNCLSTIIPLLTPIKFN